MDLRDQIHEHWIELIGPKIHEAVKHTIDERGYIASTILFRRIEWVAKSEARSDGRWRPIAVTMILSKDVVPKIHIASVLVTAMNVLECELSHLEAMIIKSNNVVDRISDIKSAISEIQKTINDGPRSLSELWELVLDARKKIDNSIYACLSYCVSINAMSDDEGATVLDDFFINDGNKQELVSPDKFIKSRIKYHKENAI